MTSPDRYPSAPCERCPECRERFDEMGRCPCDYFVDDDGDCGVCGGDGFVDDDHYDAGFCSGDIVPCPACASAPCERTER